MKLRVLSPTHHAFPPPLSPLATASGSEDDSDTDSEDVAYGNAPPPSASALLPPPNIRSPGEFKTWVKSWIALSRLYNYHDPSASTARRSRRRSHLRVVGGVASLWRRSGRRRLENGGGSWARKEHTAKLTDLPPEVLSMITAYLGPRDLATLLQTPSPYISQVAQTAISRRRHTITCLANLHTFLAYGGQSPLFYRTATMMLFGRHFVRLVPEAKSLLGLGYAVILAWFMVLFYTVPFLCTFVKGPKQGFAELHADFRASAMVIAIYLLLDLTTLMTRTTASLLLHTSPIVTTHHFPSFFRTPPKSSYTQTVRDLVFAGGGSGSDSGGQQQQPTRGLLNPWASHLYLLTNCCPNLRRLHLVGCSLAWWFRLARLDQLQELVLEGCEVDETGLEILAESCGRGCESVAFVGGQVRGGSGASGSGGAEGLTGGGGGGGDLAAGGVTGYLVGSGSGMTSATHTQQQQQHAPPPPPPLLFQRLRRVSIERRTAMDLVGLKLLLDRAPNVEAVECAADCKSLNAALGKLGFASSCASSGKDGGGGGVRVTDVEGLRRALCV
ncbi:hypothetical protein HDU87_002279 [Geranomyces variabilis]|uniref:F-box domain-containing protein n=1 Tax=Geranomyces variabilis TaxID=109894 RepID=A0AAD5TNS2_9FUNG|nr:hypothetical protein HDU87_002279 [Geranomyces variabilis]